MNERLPSELECWKCGAPLQAVPRPLTRHSLCPECKIDLHVCRMCRHYAPQYTGQCQHDFADHVTDKEKANFCDYFRPRPNAYHQTEDSRTSAAKSALADLFDSNTTDAEVSSRRERAHNETDHARQQLDDLFSNTAAPESKK